MSDVKSEKHDHQDLQEKQMKNNYSLEFTIRTSITLLEQLNPLCKNLFYFLGCLPGGLTIC